MSKTIRSIVELIRPNGVVELFRVASRLLSDEERSFSLPLCPAETNLMIVIVRIGDRNDGHRRHFGAQNAQNVDFFLKKNVDQRLIGGVRRTFD